MSAVGCHGSSSDVDALALVLRGQPTAFVVRDVRSSTRDWYLGMAAFSNLIVAVQFECLCLLQMGLVRSLHWGKSNNEDMLRSNVYLGTWRLSQQVYPLSFYSDIDMIHHRMLDNSRYGYRVRPAYDHTYSDLSIFYSVI